MNRSTNPKVKIKMTLIPKTIQNREYQFYQSERSNRKSKSPIKTTLSKYNIVETKIKNNNSFIHIRPQLELKQSKQSQRRNSCQIGLTTKTKTRLIMLPQNEINHYRLKRIKKNFRKYVFCVMAVMRYIYLKIVTFNKIRIRPRKKFAPSSQEASTINQPSTTDRSSIRASFQILQKDLQYQTLLFLKKQKEESLKKANLKIFKPNLYIKYSIKNDTIKKYVKSKQRTRSTDGSLKNIQSLDRFSQHMSQKKIEQNSESINQFHFMKTYLNNKKMNRNLVIQRRCLEPIKQQSLSTLALQQLIHDRINQKQQLSVV